MLGSQQLLINYSVSRPSAQIKRLRLNQFIGFAGYFMGLTYHDLIHLKWTKRASNKKIGDSIEKLEP